MRTATIFSGEELSIFLQKMPFNKRRLYKILQLKTTENMEWSCICTDEEGLELALLSSKKLEEAMEGLKRAFKEKINNIDDEIERYKELAEEAKNRKALVIKSMENVSKMKLNNFIEEVINSPIL